mmetsp:Transcript_3302/g.4581  ORF Transcript_3302/g.4581 Transcript_3302/m.4581 type:complete len:802 (-) Transcript_3302:35-2440(-)
MATQHAKRQKTGGASLLTNLLQEGSDLNQEVSSLRKEAEDEERRARENATKKLIGIDLGSFISKAFEEGKRNVLNVQQNHGQANVEIEARFGLVCSAGNAVGQSDAPKRAVPSKRGCGAVQTQTSDVFVSGVSEVMARETSETVKKLISQSSGNSKTWRSLESSFSSEDASLRELRMVVSQERGSFFERKSRLGIYEAALPSASYDLRIGISLEETLTSLPNQSNGKLWHTHRLKQRISTNLNFWRIDQTTVTTNSYLGLTTEQAFELARANGTSTEKANKNNPNTSNAEPLEKTAAEALTTYEIEVELLPQFAQKWPSGEMDTKPFIEELARILLALNPADILDTRRDPSIPPGNPELINKALERLRESCKYLYSNGMRRFPGSMPVGFCRRHIKQTQTVSAYAVAEKSDGERRFLVIFESLSSTKMAALIDRSLDVRLVRLTRDAMRTLPIGVILDGEIVLNLEQQVPVFLIFDVLHDGTRELSAESFDIRYFSSLNHLTGRLAPALCAKCPSTVDDDVQDSDQTFAQQAKQYNAERKNEKNTQQTETQSLFGVETVFLVPKRFCRPHDLKPKVLSKIKQELSLGNAKVFREDSARFHRSDGLIFVPRKTSYQAGSDPKLLKWKWRDGLTVDLIVGSGASRGGDLTLAAGGDDGDLVDCSRHIALSDHDKARLRADLHFFAKTTTDTKGVVVELGLDSATGFWNYHGPRPDKAIPNHIDVFISTLLLHAESPDQPEIEYRLKITDPTKDDWNTLFAATLARTTTPWREHFSKTNNRIYWWNKETGMTTWDRPRDLMLGL